jgi:hypothetical protein
MMLWGLALRILLEQREHTSRQQQSIVAIVVVVVDVDGSHFPMGCCLDDDYIDHWMVSNHTMHVE